MEALQQVIGRLHPVVVHFPIGLLITAGCIELWRWLRRREEPSSAAFTCLTIGTVTALIAAWCGWAYADHDPPGRSVDDLLFWHRWTGASVAIGSVLTTFCAIAQRSGVWPQATKAYRLLLLITTASVAWAGHLGGTLVYGEGFLFEPLRQADQEVVAPDDSPPPTQNEASAEVQEPEDAVPQPEIVLAATLPTLDFATEVWPIFESRCVKCHGPRKQKGELRLDASEYVFGESRDNWVVIPGNAAESTLVQRIILPEDDEDIMPASGKPLTEAQIEVIKRWINEGATWGQDVAVSAPEPSRTAEEREASLAPAKNSVAFAAAEQISRDLPVLSVSPLDAHTQAKTLKALEALRQRGAIAGPIAANGNAISVNMGLLGQSIVDKDLLLLDGLQSALLWLDLPRTSVTDQGLASLANYRQIQKINLSSTGIGDEGLRHLSSMTQMRSLNLYGTAVTDRGLKHLFAMNQLSSIYLWGTNVTEDGAQSLLERIPGLDIDLGKAIDVEIQAAPPPDETSEG